MLRGAEEEYRPVPGEAIPEAHKEVSAVMLRLRGEDAGFQLDQEINRRGRDATLAWPIGAVMATLFERLGWMIQVLDAVAILVVLVAAATVFTSLYNAMNERRHELAVFRSLGARRRTVFGVILVEAMTIAGLGALVGLVLQGGILVVLRGVIQERTGIVLDVFAYHPALVLTPVGLVVLGALAGLLPAAKAYRTDVAKHLVAGS